MINLHDQNHAKLLINDLKVKQLKGNDLKYVRFMDPENQTKQNNAILIIVSNNKHFYKYENFLAHCIVAIMLLCSFQVFSD